MFRDAKARYGGGPVAAWAEVTGDPDQRRRYQAARGKGGLVRVSWAEALEIAAAAHVHTLQEHGPDRIAGFSPIPAMSMASHAVGARFHALIGAPMLSFYDWYADLPIASPQVFGDQTDVPESGDWWDACCTRPHWRPSCGGCGATCPRRIGWRRATGSPWAPPPSAPSRCPTPYPRPTPADGGPRPARRRGRRAVVLGHPPDPRPAGHRCLAASAPSRPARV
ncbi:hypothetical protein GCM10010349_43100 [Streptomyces flavofungini]|nr:hypothetical protein GCM10010349_43100 [Streptomyces flavofungini]